MVFKQLTQEQIEAYHRDGYIIIREMFDAEESELLRRKSVIEKDKLEANAKGGTDRDGKSSTNCFWNHPGEDLFGMVSRCERIVNAAEAVLGDEVYHYHSKMMLKHAWTGGAWEWHQDYGYWYNNGCLYPDLVSCMIAVDRATVENGCLQVIKGSHKLGRIDHMQLDGGQTGADLERVAEAEKRLEKVYVELEVGDAVIFHANTLHCSDANESEHSRWVLICCYNARHNDPYKECVHPCYTPLKKVSDDHVKRVGREELGVTQL